MILKHLKPMQCRLACATLLMGVAAASHASVISFDTRYSTSGPLANAAAYQTLVDGLTAAPATAGYCSTSPTSWNGLRNQTNCGGVNGNLAFEIEADFGVSSGLAGSWSFRVGPDFGRGGALFIDGVAMDFRSTDMWWNGSYGNATQILSANLVLGAGNHTLEVYGLEGCCDGAQQAQFLAPGATNWTIFSNDDGLNRVSTSVPEPGSLALAALGLIGLATRRRSAAR